jgi:hypothetical protein
MLRFFIAADHVARSGVRAILDANPHCKWSEGSQRKDAIGKAIEARHCDLRLIIVADQWH